MATTPKAYQYDAIKGADIEYGTLTVTPGSVSANAQKNCNPDTASPVCNAGDLIDVVPQALENGLAVVAAQVSGTNTVQVTVANTTGSPITGAQQTYFYQLVRFQQ